MSKVDYSELFSAMAEGPSVLLLGQDLLRVYDGEDYFLTACKARFDLASADSYANLISNCGDSEDLMSIWHNISSHIAVPDAIERLVALPWNCVLTSSIHDVLDRALAADWRLVNPVFNDNTFPSDPRSRIKLNLYKLFGCVTRDVDIEQPPRDELQQLQRNGIAEAMLRQLPSLVTPKGMLFIDSLSPDDWLSIKALSEAVSQLGSGQAHVFGVTPDIESVREIKLLLRLGKIELHALTIGQALNRLNPEQYHGLVSARRTWVEGVEFTFPSGRKHVFKPAEWRRLTNGVTLLTDADARTRYNFASADEKYRRFRDFLYGSHGVPDWQAVASGLAFERHEFSALKAMVVDLLEKQHLNEEPILVSGQSGSGKSVALADLAVKIRCQGWPVLYFGRNQTDIDSGLIETICTDLDRLESTSVLLIWDASCDADSYSSLASYLASRGRKVVVVGSTYQSDSRVNCIEFSPIMDPKDAERFRSHLEAFDPHLVEDISSKDFEKRNFWAWLWRLLPEARGRLRVGLLGEIETYEQKLESSLESAEFHAPVATGTLGAILTEAGIYAEQTDRTETIDVKNARGKAASYVERLTGLILAPGSYGQDVPVDLVLRCLGREGFDVLREALRGSSIFRWIEDESGNHSLGARQQLEALTIVRSRFSQTESFEFIKVLLRSVHAQGDWRVFNFEVDFVIRILKAIGPESTLRNPTADELIELADVLDEITTSSGSQANPRLAFNEGYFRREALLRKRGIIDWDSTEEVAEQVPDLISEFHQALVALQRAESAHEPSSSDRKQKRALSRIHTEFAGLYGLAQDIQLKVAKLLPGTNIERSVQHSLGTGFDNAVKHCKRAAVFDSENYYPQDVCFRVTKAQFGASSDDPRATSEQKVELVSELCDILDHESWMRSPEQYNKRKLELADVLNDDTIKREALQELAKLGSTAGEYMLAWKDIYYPDRTWRPDHEIEFALERIEALGSKIDLRLTRLYTQGWWRCYGKVDLFESERSTAALSRQQWEHYSKWLNRRLAFSEEESLRARFFYAWALFQTGQYRESIEQFRLLDRSTMAGRCRVVKLCLWSDEDGLPITCQGTIRRVSEDTDKGWVYVPILRREIAFRPHDFKAQTILNNRPLEDFHITFNFRGPIADPARLYHQVRRV